MSEAQGRAGLGWRVWAALAVGLLLLAAAPVLRFVVTPALAQSPRVPLPTTYTSSGTISTLLDFEPEGDEPASTAPIPVTRTLTTTGDARATAQGEAAGLHVAVTRTQDETVTADGRIVADSQYQLAADRSTQLLADCCDVEVAGVEFPMAGAGSPLRLPWFTPERTYPYLDTTLLAATDLDFIGWDRVEDRDAMKFQQTTAPTPVGQVPVPGRLVGSDAPTVPLARAYSVNRTLWVDQTTGIILRSAERVRETLRDDEDKDVLVLLAMTLASTPEQDAAQVAAARDQGRPVLWTHTYGPLIALVLGGLALLLAAIGVVRTVRARRVEQDFPDELRTFEDLKEAFE